MGRPRLHDEQLRQRLLDAATDLMAAEGPDFSLRPLVASVGTSTSAVYSLFGSRGELVEAITLRAVRSFVDAQLDAPAGAPMERVLGLAHACRAWAHEHRTMFQVVFGGARGSAAVEEARERTMQPLLEVVQDAVAQGVLEGDPQVAARTIFAALHGSISLELLGLHSADEADALFDAQLAALWRSWASPEHRDAVAA